MAWGSGRAYFRAQRLAVARCAVLPAFLVFCLLAVWPAVTQAATIGTLSAVTVSSTVLTGGQAAADAVVLGPQSFTLTTGNAYTPSTRISIAVNISGAASFSASTTPTIAGMTCQAITVVQNRLIFEGCGVTTNGTVAFQVAGVSYTNGSGLSVYQSSVTLSGTIYNASNTTQLFETIPTVTAISSPAVAYTLTPTTTGTGSGTIAVSPLSPTYSYGSTVTLTANAAGGSSFTAWGGACTGAATTCTVTITGNTAVSATFTRASTYTLTTAKNGTGTGTLSVNPITSAYPAGTVVTVTATPATGSALAAWSGGGCSGTALTCQVTMTANTTVTATFNSTLTYDLTVVYAGTGSGTVSANPFATSYVPGTSVTLTAAASSGSSFTGWSGACTGTTATCTVTMSTARSVTATFAIVNSYTLTVSTAGTGAGAITASPAATSYVDGTVVTLTATAEAGSTFTGWSGVCSDTAATCQITMNANKAAAGTFTRNITGVLRQAGVFSSVSPTYQSFLRFYNAGGTAGTVTVTLSDYASGIALGQWTSPSIAPGTAPQYAISTLEGVLPGFSAKPAMYSVTMQAQFNGTFQHILWKPGDGTLTNLSTCDSGTAPILTRAANVHNGALGAAGYASSIVVYNTSTVAASVVLHVADAANGASLGTYAPAAIPANGQVVVTIPVLESALGITSTGALSHYIVTVQNIFTGYMQHLLSNTSVGVITDMSAVCTFPALTASVPTNPSGAP